MSVLRLQSKSKAYKKVMAKKIIVINGSPKKNGNTAALIEWFSEGCREKGAQVEVAYAAGLKLKAAGCTSCRKCQARKEYACVIDDDVQGVLAQMLAADVIVMATPLYFFSASAQLKVVMDRMFALYKWDNSAGTFSSPLEGKTFVLLGSAYEKMGLDALRKPFSLTAEYTGMRFESLLVPDAGASGEIRKKPGVRPKAAALGRRVAG